MPNDQAPQESFRPNRPRDERDELNLPKPEQPDPIVRERETIHSDHSSMELERIGMRFEGLDGKHYLGSYAVHLYEVKKLFNQREHVWLIQSTDMTQVPEQVLTLTVRELGRALMKRFGHQPPRKTTDYQTRESERKET